MLKLPLRKNNSDTILSIPGGGLKKFNTFLKGTSPKVNWLGQLEFELAYSAAVVFSH